METISRKGYQIKAQAKSAEILIYDEIGESWLGGISAKQFAEDVKALPKVDDITVRINSEGGSVFDGTAIYNTLKNHKATISVKIDGLAASIASIIAMAGDTIEMAENGFMMIHDPWMVAAGTAEELRSQADVMDKVQEKLVSTYAKRTGSDSEQIAEWMAAETWMTADEAHERGFIDTITDASRMAAKVRNRERYKHLPPDLKEDKRPRAENRKRDTYSYIAASMKSRNL